MGYDQNQMKRDNSADFAKAVLIVIVILGHAIQFGSGLDYYSEGLYWEDKLVQAICSFHMPCFMLISGFFHFGSVEKYGNFQSLLNRIKKLLPPLACWAPIFLVAGVLTGRYSFSMKRLLICFLTDFWFLWAVLFCTALITLLILLPSKMRHIVCCIIILGLALAPDFLLIPATYKWLFIYFVVGYLIAAHTGNSIPKIKPIIGIGSAILWVVMLFFYNKNMFIYTSGWSVLFPAGEYNVSEMIYINLFRSIIAFFGTLSFLWLCQMFYELVIKKGQESKACKITYWVGRKTLPIYMIQMVIFEFCMLAITGSVEHNLLINVIETILVLIISIVIIHVLEKNKVTKRAFLGL